MKYRSVKQLEDAVNAYFAACEEQWVDKTVWTAKRNKSGKKILDEDGYEIQVERTTKVLRVAQPVTMSGLAAALGVDRKTLRSYSHKKEFLPTVQAARRRVEAYWEGLLASQFSSGAKFNLTNNYDEWSDKQVLAGDPDAPLMPIGLDAAILARKQSGKAPSSPAADS